MKRMLQATVTVLALAVLAVVSESRAEVLEVTPSRAAVLPSDGTVMAKVALVFDLSGMREGDGRRHIASATLEWPLNDIPSDRLTEYALHQLTAPWVEGRSLTVELPEEPLEQWDFTPTDHDVLGGGLVRFQLEGLVESWLAGRAQNHGVVIVTQDLDGDTLAQQLAKVKLTILYGFLR